MLRIGLFAVLVFLAFGQSSSAGTTVSFPAMLDGGSKGVPHLNGTISLFDNRIEFEAFPQVENLELSCTTIRGTKPPRRKKNLIRIDSGGAAYRFDLYSVPQAERFMAALAVACRQT